MKHFFWIIDGSLFPYLKGKGGVSASYIVPQAHSPSSVESLAGATVWMVLRTAKADILFARIHVVQVDQFEDGSNVGDYLISIDQSKSFRLIADLDSNEKITLGQSIDMKLGMIEIALPIARDIERTASKKRNSSFRQIPPRLLNKIPEPKLLGNKDADAKRAIISVTESYALEEVWASRVIVNLGGPFANFAEKKINEAFGIGSPDLLSELTHYDPTNISTTSDEIDPSFLEKNKETPQSHAIKTQKPPVVDVDLAPIDPDSLFSRKFIARERNALDLQTMLEKTELAEKSHQDILRDVATHIKSLGMTPMQSASIDLFVEANNRASLFEIKSANEVNFLNQTSKAVFQLMCYKAALTKEGRDIRNLVLIIEKMPTQEMNQYVRSVLEPYQITILFYDASASWPHKLPGLHELLAV